MLDYREFWCNKLLQYPTIKNTLNIPIAFDIETTSIVTQDNKFAFPYIWMIGFYDKVYYGREIKDCIALFDKLNSWLYSNNLKAIIYVHNLSFEFQFLKSYIMFDKVFARTERHPIYAEYGNITFKCSYFLSNLSLAGVAEVNNLGIKKMSGDLDYTLIRHSKTPLTDKELNYCEYDILVLLKYISQEIKKNNNDINKIPLTSTGYVRKHCRDYMTTSNKYFSARNLIKKIHPDKCLYLMLEKAFAGGYTHCNAFYMGLMIPNVDNYDFCSHYPAKMCGRKYPMTAFKEVTKNFDAILKNKNIACVCYVEYSNIKIRYTHSIISQHKLIKKQNAKFDNNRLVYADSIGYICTDLDLKNIDLFYTYDIRTIKKMYISHYGYLPKYIIDIVLELYENKTQYKNVKGKETIYMLSKQLLNAMYGMCVTSPINDNIVYDNIKGWETLPADENALEDYYNKFSTFLTYQWGVWVTAWARYDLLSTIAYSKKFADSVIYCDTDSIKKIPCEDDNKAFESKNKEILDGIKDMCEYYNIDFNRFSPKDIDGIAHPLGVWDYEGKAEYFKTLGAKRYIMYTKGKIKSTVAGCSKIKLSEYLVQPNKNVYGAPSIDEVFDKFNLDLNVPTNYSGRLTHYYCENDEEIPVTDYLGNESIVNVKSGVCLEPSEYSMNISKDYIMIVLGYNNSKIVNERMEQKWEKQNTIV